ncbi:metal ABC transporter ATP-binding protein [Hydrogenivirga sp. 128-5-R1-1]|uniref:metal ABC transporter ATP-binding protein n=1 Tax=Hydrogenivirga sp. 128-5-R1-1 TaxID=392423 RepID=UPI00015EF73E|nr:metal ABC transporter ATP-binding protein [Hydrogenivirga sp. 128-5-R1-1]EDP75705.1 ABC transporter [Hydrogenivirga sp. 128-5-R1-1]
MYILEVENLYFSYTGKDSVLENVSFKVKEGEFVGIVGPNGAGKTTLFRILLGFLRPSSGTVRLFGTDIKHFKHWHRIGYVPQRLNVEQNFPATVRELLSLVASGERAKEIAEFLHIDDYIDRQFLKLSGGQQQLVLLGMAIASDPDLLLLDEPTSGLDIHAQMHILQILKELSLNEGKTVLMISHDIGLVLKNVDRVLCINRGVYYYGEPEDALDAIEELFGIGRGLKDGAT